MTLKGFDKVSHKVFFTFYNSGVNTLGNKKSHLITRLGFKKTHFGNLHHNTKPESHKKCPKVSRTIWMAPNRKIGKDWKIFSKKRKKNSFPGFQLSDSCRKQVRGESRLRCLLDVSIMIIFPIWEILTKHEDKILSLSIFAFLFVVSHYNHQRIIW